MLQKSSIREISSLDHPDLKPYRTLRRPLEHRNRGIFIAEGEKVVRRLLASSLTVESILITPERLSGIQSEFERRIQEVTQRVYVADQKLLESIVGFNLHQGIMAVGRIPVAHSLQETVLGLPHPRLFLALDGLVNSENVGVIVRNAAAFGVHAILVGETSSSPYLRRAVRNSMGAVFQIPVVHSGNIAGDLGFLTTQGTIIVGTDPAGSAMIQEADFRGDVCIVVGNEGGGMSENVRRMCTRSVAIPMQNGTDSLNVACASAVFLYEVAKQRGHR
jgi:tRNA G18 (ribose-2'-O)-methylase SpoU